MKPVGQAQAQETFGQRLKRMRIAAGYPAPSDLARAMWGERRDSRGFLVAANRDTIHRYEKDGGGIPGRKNLLKLAKALRCEPEDLLPDSPSLAAVNFYRQGGSTHVTSHSLEQAASVGSNLQIFISHDSKTARLVVDKILNATDANRLFQELLKLDMEMSVRLEEVGPDDLDGVTPDGAEPETDQVLNIKLKSRAKAPT